MRAPELVDPDPLDLQLMRGYPRAHWLDPVRIHGELGGERYACRLCIARGGLARTGLYLNTGEHRAHLEQFHHLELP